MTFWSKVKGFLYPEPSPLMVFLYPDEKSIEKISSIQKEAMSRLHIIPKNILESYKFHVTLRWWKDNSPKTNAYLISEVLDKIPFEEAFASTVRLQSLGNSLSIILDSQHMHSTYKLVDLVVRSHGGPPSDYPTYTPHVALFYDDFFSNKDIRDTISEEKLIFNRISILDKNKKLLFNKSLKERK